MQAGRQAGKKAGRRSKGYPEVEVVQVMTTNVHDVVQGHVSTLRMPDVRHGIDGFDSLLQSDLVLLTHLCMAEIKGKSYTIASTSNFRKDTLC